MHQLVLSASTYFFLYLVIFYQHIYSYSTQETVNQLSITISAHQVFSMPKLRISRTTLELLTFQIELY